jgi:hypothetical protein
MIAFGPVEEPLHLLEEDLVKAVDIFVRDRFFRFLVDNNRFADLQKSSKVRSRYWLMIVDLTSTVIGTG